MLCKKILLKRISKQHFEYHIARAFSKRWKKNMAAELIDIILLKTECHSYYVNMLCDKLWDQDAFPTALHIDAAWQDTLNENKGKVIADLAQLNTNRIKVLSMIAECNVVNEPSSKQFLDHVKLPLASTQNAVKYLLDYDYIHETEIGLQLVDPVIKAFLRAR